MDINVQLMRQLGEVAHQVSQLTSTLANQAPDLGIPLSCFPGRIVSSLDSCFSVPWHLANAQFLSIQMPNVLPLFWGCCREVL